MVRFCAAAGMLGILLGGGIAAAQNPPALDGVWQVKTPVVQLRDENGGMPPLLPAAAAIYRQRIAMMTAGDHSYDATQTGCKPMGEPRTGYDGWPFEILQGHDELFFGFTWNRMMREIDITNKFGAIPGPMYYGVSIAHWDGDALVVQVKDLNGSTLLDAAGMPHSDALQLTERFTLTGQGTGLRERISFDDPNTFSRPWDAVIDYVKRPGARIAEDLCLQRLGITLKAPPRS